MQPIDYTSQIQPVNIAGNIGAGFQVGAGIQNELQRRRDEQIARQQAEQQQIAAMKRAAEYERDLMGVFNDPSPQNLARLQITYPERIKEFQAGFETLDKARVDDERKFLGQLYSATGANPEVAKKLLTDRITALESNREDATEEKNALDLLNTDPKAARGQIGIMYAHVATKDQIESLVKLGGEERAAALAPAELAVKQAEAAAAPAKYAFDIAKVQEDIRASRENTRLRAIEAQLKVTDNALKRDELILKRDEAKRAIDEKIQGREAELNSALYSTDNFLNTADRALQVFTSNPSVVRNATGTIQARLPTFGQDTADFEGLIETLSSQTFLAQIPSIKGLGQLSNEEGKKLQSSLQNFDLKQSPKRLRENLIEAQRLISKARENIINRYGAADRAPPPDVRGGQPIVPPANFTPTAPGQPIVVDY